MLLCAVALLVIEAICALVLPGYMADIVNDGVIPGNIPFIWRAGGIMLGVTLLSVAAAVTMGYFSAKTSTGVANDLRESVFQKVLRFSNAEMNNFNTSSLITRTTNDISQVQTTMMMAIRLFIYAPIIGIGGIIRALDRSASMTWIIAIATITMIGLMGILFVIAMPKYKLWQTLVDRLNLVARENLSGILIVRAFSTQKFESKRFDKANKHLYDTGMFVDQSFAFMMPIIMLIMNLTTAIIVWVGARQASAFQIDIGDIFAFLQYGMLIIFAFLMVAFMFTLLPRAAVSAERIREVLETDSSILYKDNNISFNDSDSETFNATIEFKDVSFRFPDTLENDENVLNNISFTAKPGETTAIIGSTGSGKSTILNLLLRFYDVNTGAILLNGIDIRDLSKEDLHDKVGYVPQKALLFTGTIESNLLYADKTATKSQIQVAAEIAQATEFIESKEDGYNSHVAQGGSNLSGGQRQRLSIARALVKNTPIYLFDDSFSALDLKTDAKLRAALKQKMADRTKIIVAQRISSIMDAEQIVVLEHGRIVGLGKHSDLIKTCEVYKEIAASQLSEEELMKE